jgi:hypothetical protein
VIIVAVATVVGCDETVTVRGLVRQVGNSPHVETLISGVAEGDDERRDYYVKGDLVDECAAFTGTVVIATGVVSSEEYRVAHPDAKSRIRFFLDVKSVELAP